MSGVVVLTGGVGGAKLVLGLTRVMPAERVTAIVNTGDDFTHFGLAISPDIDTLLYTLSGKANRTLGWGREGESWNFMAAMRELGGEDWFNLGDGDLALHILRSSRLAAGEPLSAIVGDVARAWGIAARILPMSDDPVATMIDTVDDGLLAFQRYFVERRCAPAVRAIRFEGAGSARPAPGVVEAIASASVVLVAPSNPYLSVDPLLAIPQIASALATTRAKVVAVSPIVDGKAVKGPTAKLMDELGIPVSARSVAEHYGAFLDGMVVDERDPPEALAVPSLRVDSLMETLEDRERVASAALALASSLA